MYHLFVQPKNHCFHLYEEGKSWVTTSEGAAFTAFNELIFSAHTSFDLDKTLEELQAKHSGIAYLNSFTSKNDLNFDIKDRYPEFFL